MLGVPAVTRADCWLDRPVRTRRQNLGEWLAAENRRRGGLARIWPRRVKFPSRSGVTLWVAALVLATTVAMQPFEHGATVVPAEPGQWLIESVTPGGPAWRAGLSAGDVVAWDGPSGEPIGRPVELSTEIGGGALADPQTGSAIPIPGLDPAMRATTLALATTFAAGGAVVALYGRRRVLRSATAAMFTVAIALCAGLRGPRRRRRAVAAGLCGDWRDRRRLAVVCGCLSDTWPGVHRPVRAGPGGYSPGRTGRGAGGVIPGPAGAV